ncbi:MAG: hypothetical protein AAFZ15_13730 [Bacteroidota bacterium]
MVDTGSSMDNYLIAFDPLAGKIQTEFGFILAIARGLRKQVKPINSFVMQYLKKGKLVSSLSISSLLLLLNFSFVNVNAPTGRIHSPDTYKYVETGGWEVEAVEQANTVTIHVTNDNGGTGTAGIIIIQDNAILRDLTVTLGDSGVHTEVFSISDGPSDFEIQVNNPTIGVETTFEFTANQ